MIVSYRAVVGMTFLAALLLAGCGGSKPAAKSTQAPPERALKLTVDGTAVKLPLEVMDVNLVEDDAYAETFEIKGQGVTLVGSFPLSIHVDYGEHWEVLKGQSIPISASMDNPRVEPQSFIDLPGLGRAQVTGGSFTVNSITGEYPAPHGSLTLSGSIKLDIKTPTGAKSLTGTFAVHAATWG